jgi:hypothetical protein
VQTKRTSTEKEWRTVVRDDPETRNAGQVCCYFKRMMSHFILIRPATSRTPRRYGTISRVSEGRARCNEVQNVQLRCDVIRRCLSENLCCGHCNRVICHGQIQLCSVYYTNALQFSKRVYSLLQRIVNVCGRSARPAEA